MYGSPISGILNQTIPTTDSAISGYAVAGIAVAGTGSPEIAAIQQVFNLPSPISIVLNSSASDRTIQLSFDGVNFNPPVTPTYIATGQIVYILNFPVTHVRFNGNLNDTYTILS